MKFIKSCHCNYRNDIPQASVAVGWSNASAHWASHETLDKLATLEPHPYMPFNASQLSEESTYFKKWQTLFKDDLCRCLKCRAREFKNDGLLAMTVTGL